MQRLWVEKTPVHLATTGQGGGAARRLKARLARENWDTTPGFKFRPGFIYTQVRAISARINQNYDGWPAAELKKSYRSFLGKPVFVNHENYNPKMARGVVVAARFVNNPNDQYIDVIQEIDAGRFPKLAKEIITGGMDSVSMGAEAAFTICSYCSHKATDESDMCDHVMFHKGEKLRKFNRRTGKVDQILVYEKCMKLSFFELSYVFDPADETAVASKVLVASRKTAAVHPDWDETPWGWRHRPTDTEVMVSYDPDTGDEAGYDLSHEGEHLEFQQDPHAFVRDSPHDLLQTYNRSFEARVLEALNTCPPGAICDKPEEQGSTMGGTGVGTSSGGATGQPASSTSGGSSSGGTPQFGDAKNLPSTKALYDDLSKTLPGVEIGTFRVDDYHEHDHGAMDVMTSDPEQAAMVRQKAFDAGAPYVLWQQQQWNSDGSVSKMEDRGSPTQNHMDHVHTAPISAPKASPDIITTSFERKVLRVAGYKTGIYNDLDMFPEDAKHIQLPEGHALHIFPPSRGVPGIAGVMPDRPGNPQHEWVHTHHGEPINSGMANSHQEAAQQGKDSYEAERAYGELMPANWDPDRDPKDPRYEARRRAAKIFERRVLMTAGYDKLAAGFLTDDEWLDTDGPDDQMFDQLPRGKRHIEDEFEDFHNPEGYSHYPDPEHHDIDQFEEQHYPKWGLHPDDYATIAGEKPPNMGMPPYESPNWPPNQRGTFHGRPASRKLAWGETEAPPQVDTLRPEGSVPEDDNDDYHEFVNPADQDFANNNTSPQELLTPDLEQAGNIDREQAQEPQQGQMPPQQGQMPPGAPQQPQPQMMTLQIPIPPQQGQIPMQSFAARVLKAAGYRLAADEPKKKDDDKSTTRKDDGPDQPPDTPRSDHPEPGAQGTFTGPGAPVPGAPGRAPAPGAPAPAGPVNEHVEHGHTQGAPPGPGGAALENWQLPGGTNPTDPNHLSMPFAQSQVGQYSPTLNHTVTNEDVSGKANQGNIDAWNKANPTNVFDPDMKYDPSTMQKGVQHIFTKPGPEGAGAPPPPAAGAPPAATTPAEADAVIDQVGLGSTAAPPTPPPAAAPAPPTPELPPAAPQTVANRRLIAYFNEYFGTNVENTTLGNGRGVSRTSRKPEKGSTMGRTNTLAQRGKVASQGRRQHFADGPYTDGGPFGVDDSQGEQEDAFITDVPPAEPVDMPDDDTHNISNTEGNLVARVNRGRQQLLADARQLAAYQAGKKAGANGSRRTAESISMDRAGEVNPNVQDSASEELTGDHFEAVGDSPQDTAPHQASRSLAAFEAFDKWLHAATGRQARHLSEVGIKRAAAEWGKRGGYDPRVLFPALGIVLRQARKNEAAIKAAAAQKGAPMRKRAVDLDLAAPDGRVDVEAPVADVTDAEAQESQFDLSDYADNAGDSLADPDLDTDSQFWAPGEGDKGANKESRRQKTPTPKAGGILAVRAAEAYIRAGLEPNTNERKYQLAGMFENMNRGAVQRDIALLERVAHVQSQQRQKVASGKTRGAGQSIPPGLTRSGTVRAASTRRTSANDPMNDALLFG